MSRDLAESLMLRTEILALIEKGAANTAATSPESTAPNCGREAVALLPSKIAHRAQ